MRLLSSSLTLGLLASLSGLALHSSAYACDVEAPVRWNPERSWPAACESNIPTDGFVLLEGDALPADIAGGQGQLDVTIERTIEGAAVELFAGKLSFPDAKSALFQSDRPLSPQADYQITAFRRSPDGQEQGSRFTSKFTTGELALAPLSLSAPTLQLEQFDKELEDCALDACGLERCESLDQTVATTYVRVAVPPIEGGIEQRPYAVSAALTVRDASDPAAVVATSDTAATQAGKRSFLVIEVPASAAGREGCVSVTATDLAGHEQTSESVCLALGQAEVAPEPSGAAAPAAAHTAVAEPSLLSEHVDAVSADTDAAVAQAGGCAVAATGESASGLGWLALALTLARLRARKRAA
jgi:hypothetical protein